MTTSTRFTINTEGAGATPACVHRSTAYVKPITEHGRTWKPDPMTDQFRFVVRMAYACHERNVAYDHGDG